MSNNALILTNGLLNTENGKTAHGLIRASERFKIVGVIDYACAGRDAGEVLDGKHRNIPIFATLENALKSLQTSNLNTQHLIIGVAVAGGKIPPDMLSILKKGIKNGLHIVNGLHEFLNDKPEFIRLAKKHNVTITDVRRYKKVSEMHYWSGRIQQVTVPRVAVLGMDCAVGKRTTSRFLMEACRKQGIKSEIISTGQTGWIQDGRYGFMLDATLNDFVTGELETQIVRCFEETNPDVIFINGQSALRNPIGPCGAELLLSGQAIALIKMYGSEVIAVTLNTHGLTLEDARNYQKILRGSLGIPVVLPLEDGVGEVVEVIKKI
jgi:uncharacterized NAD-dependent epimerase/dehydratase family protein